MDAFDSKDAVGSSDAPDRSAEIENSEFDKYEAEAAEKWGGTDAYREYAAKAKRYSAAERRAQLEEMNGLISEFAASMQRGELPGAPTAQKLVKALQDHISAYYYNCTDGILAGLGQLYVSAPRFRHNIDKHAVGTAEYMRDAIALYCARNN